MAQNCQVRVFGVKRGKVMILAGWGGPVSGPWGSRNHGVQGWQSHVASRYHKCMTGPGIRQWGLGEELGGFVWDQQIGKFQLKIKMPNNTLAK